MGRNIRLLSFQFSVSICDKYVFACILQRFINLNLCVLLLGIADCSTSGCFSMVMCLRATKSTLRHCCC